MRSAPVVFGCTVNRTSPSPGKKSGNAGESRVIQLTSEMALQRHENVGSTSTLVLREGSNNKAYDALTAEHKAIVEAACAFCHHDMQAKYDARNAAALKQLVSAGAKLFPFPKDMMDAAFKEAMALYSEIGAKNANWKKVYEDFAAFRRDVNLWFRFTEATFDDFMQRQKL